MMLFLCVNVSFSLKKYYTRILKENNSDTIDRAIIGNFFKRRDNHTEKKVNLIYFYFFEVDTKNIIDDFYTKRL